MAFVLRLTGIVLFGLAASLAAGQDSPKKKLDAVIISGPQFHPPRSSHEFEDSASPRIARLRKGYRLDEVVRGESSELQSLLKLRHWVHSR